MQRLILMLALALALSLVVIAGCGPPAGTMELLVDGKPVVVRDVDEDGVPDVDEAGNIQIVKGSGALLTIVDKLDDFGPIGLELAGGITGLSILGTIAASWRKRKYGRVLANTIMSVQHGRERIAQKGLPEMLNILDDALKGSQTGESVVLIKQIKNDLGLASVSAEKKVDNAGG